MKIRISIMHMPLGTSLEKIILNQCGHNIFITTQFIIFSKNSYEFLVDTNVF